MVSNLSPSDHTAEIADHLKIVVMGLATEAENDGRCMAQFRADLMEALLANLTATALAHDEEDNGREYLLMDFLRDQTNFWLQEHYGHDQDSP